MVAMSGNKTKEGKQGEIDGLLKAAGYTIDMVFKFWMEERKGKYDRIYKN